MQQIAGMNLKETSISVRLPCPPSTTIYKLAAHYVWSSLICLSCLWGIQLMTSMYLEMCDMDFNYGDWMHKSNRQPEPNSCCFWAVPPRMFISPGWQWRATPASLDTSEFGTRYKGWRKVHYSKLSSNILWCEFHVGLILLLGVLLENQETIQFR